MLKKLNDLQFVIGLFFSVVSVILLLNVLLAGGSGLNLYTGVAFLIFGVAMMFITGKSSRQS
jgi:hypothetical protein